MRFGVTGSDARAESEGDVGVHERYNRRWAIENGPGLKQRDPAHASYWLREWLNDGTLAGAAWTGFVRMPKFGLYQILERVHSST
jgi:hypothetical protein